MDISTIFMKFKNQDSCIKYLEKVRWHNKPICPYCGSDRATKRSKEEVQSHRYHCGACNKSYCVTVGTIFHSTHLPLQKWFLAITIIANAKKGISSRELARQLGVNKDTAWKMQMQIREAMNNDIQSDLMDQIVECDEMYIGGKKKKGDKKKDDNDDFINTRGRGTDKQGVIGIVERETGKVVAKKQDDFSFTAIKAFIGQFVDLEKATLYTDDFRGYKPFSKIMKHLTINHSQGEFSREGINTNTIEGFWGLFKRSVSGSYHKLSVKYLDKYIQECCFKYNNRDNKDMFGLLVKRGVII